MDSAQWFCVVLFYFHFLQISNYASISFPNANEGIARLGRLTNSPLHSGHSSLNSWAHSGQNVVS